MHELGFHQFACYSSKSIQSPCILFGIRHFPLFNRHTVANIPWNFFCRLWMSNVCAYIFDTCVCVCIGAAPRSIALSLSLYFLCVFRFFSLKSHIQITQCIQNIILNFISFRAIHCEQNTLLNSSKNGQRYWLWSMQFKPDFRMVLLAINELFVFNITIATIESFRRCIVVVAGFLLFFFFATRF